jgi:hypothetical protein
MARDTGALMSLRQTARDAHALPGLQVNLLLRSGVPGRGVEEAREDGRAAVATERCLGEGVRGSRSGGWRGVFSWEGRMDELMEGRSDAICDATLWPFTRVHILARRGWHCSKTRWLRRDWVRTTAAPRRCSLHSDPGALENEHHQGVGASCSGSTCRVRAHKNLSPHL